MSMPMIPAPEGPPPVDMPTWPTPGAGDDECRVRVFADEVAFLAWLDQPEED